MQWKSFELDPGARSYDPNDDADDGDYADRLARKYGIPGAQPGTDTACGPDGCPV